MVLSLSSITSWPFAPFELALRSPLAAGRVDVPVRVERFSGAISLLLGSAFLVSGLGGDFLLRPELAT